VTAREDEAQLLGAPPGFTLSQEEGRCDWLNQPSGVLLFTLVLQRKQPGDTDVEAVATRPSTGETKVATEDFPF
jgi:hypothetical protein